MTREIHQHLRILAVAKREPWPLNSGGTLRLYHLLANLSEPAHVTLALPQPPRFRPHLPPAWNLAAMDGPPAPDRRPGSLIARLARRHFGYDRRIAGWLHRHARPGGCDVVYLYGAVLGVYAEDLSVPFVWDPADDLVLYNVRNGLQAGPREWLPALRRAALYALYQRYVGSHARATLFCSPVDAGYARRWMKARQVEVVRTCVDTDYYRPPADAPDPGTVVFVGSLNFPPNVDGIVRFATQAWPAIHADAPGRKLLIVGKNPVDAVLALGTRPGVQLVGQVPDVRPYLARAAVVIAPTIGGGGVKNKVLQACAMARPVVASPRAIAGLTIRPGIEILIAHRPTEWVRQVRRLLAEPEFAGQIAQAGYQWVLRACRWPDAASRLEDILRRACGLAEKHGEAAAQRTAAACADTGLARRRLVTIRGAADSTPPLCTAQEAPWR